MKTALTCMGVLLLLVIAACSIPPDNRPGEGYGLITLEDETRLGYYMESVTDRKFLPLENKAVHTAVNEIGRNIVSHIAEPPFNFAFKVLNNPNENAFAIPGGTVYITSGLLEKLKTSHQVAGVLAHEIAHITARHPAHALQNAQIATGALATLNIAAVIGLAAARQPAAAADMARIATTLLTTITYQGYSRAYELQADRLGMEYMERAEYTPQGLIEALNVLRTIDQEKAKKLNASSTPELLSSHPNLEDRIQALTDILETRSKQ